MNGYNHFKKEYLNDDKTPNQRMSGNQESKYRTDMPEVYIATRNPNSQLVDFGGKIGPLESELEDIPNLRTAVDKLEGQ